MTKISLRLLAHSPSANTKRLSSAIIEGCEYGFEQAGVSNIGSNIDSNIDSNNEPELICGSPLKSDSSFALGASGIVLYTPENFGYMSGALKDWFDRTFYDLERQTQALPYAICVRAGKDGTGAIRSIQSIAKGLGWKQVVEPIIVKGDINKEAIEKTKEFAATFAAGLSLGIF